MAGRRHVVSVRERKSYDEIIRLATAAPSNVTVGVNSPTTPGPSTTTTPLEFEAASCSKNKERDREREREKEGAVGVGAGAGAGLKRLLGDKISSLTSGGTINTNASNTINNTNTNISTNTDDQHVLPNQSITPVSLALSGATTLAQGTSSSIASTLLGSTTMASPPMASSMQSSKLHASPSKPTQATPSIPTPSSKGTYDAKIVQQEMHRLGSLAQFPGGPSLGLAGSGAAIGMGGGVSGTGPLALLASGGVGGGVLQAQGVVHGMGLGSVGGGVGVNTTDGGSWTRLHVLVLPLFNHEQLQHAIEDLNLLVKRHIESVVARGPGRTISTLESDATELINTGMITLNAKLKGCEDENLLTRVVETWCFFWDQVLPYVEGVLLPLQTDPMLLNLSRTKQPQRTTSPQDTTPTTHIPSLSSSHASSSTTPIIDVRMLALRAFRDKIVYPIAGRLESRLAVLSRRESVTTFGSGGVVGLGGEGGYQPPRLQQMLLVLHSQAQRARSALSLTAPPPTPTLPEVAIRRLLDALTISRVPSPLTGSATARSLYYDQNRPLPASPKSPQTPANATHVLSNGDGDNNPNSNNSTPVRPSLNGGGSPSVALTTSPSLTPQQSLQNGSASRSRYQSRVPTFSSSGPPRDRRGRVAGKRMGGLSLGVGGVGVGVDGSLSQKRKGRVGLGGLEAPNGTGANGDVSVNGGLRIGVNGGGGGMGDWGELDVDGDGDGGETPRIGFNKNWEGERFLESLRSPDLENRDGGPTVAFAGGPLTGSGGGLGTGPPWGFNIVEGYNSADSDEEMALGWDHHQAVVERMVGIPNGLNGNGDVSVNGSSSSAVLDDEEFMSLTDVQARRRRRMT